MMTEYTPQTQTLGRDFFAPSEPTTEDVVILGENAADTADSRELTTEDVVVLGENEYSLPFELPVQGEKPTLEERVDWGLQSSKHGFDSWLLIKVKDELTVQLFQGGLDGASIDTTRIAAMLEEEIIAEQARHAEDAERLQEELIPAAELRDKPDYTAGHSFVYWQEDVENLRERKMVHSGMASFIASMPRSGEDWALDLAQGYVDRAKESAEVTARALLESELTDDFEAQAA